ncbi:MAG: nitroreductase/quinone reductase family protein [Anaerolineaceae bacterium]
MNSKAFDWRKMRPAQNLHRLLYAIGLGPVVGKIILLLTTTGRKSGLPRVTPLQYELIDGKYCLGAARGKQADWVRNIEVNPKVQVRVKRLKFSGTARVSTDVKEIADFLEIRLQRHPLMIGLMMEKIHHLSKRPTRSQLEELASEEALVIISKEENCE